MVCIRDAQPPYVLLFYPEERFPGYERELSARQAQHGAARAWRERILPVILQGFPDTPLP